MNACILIVDDNATNLKLAAEVLEFEGHVVMRAVDAEDAIIKLQQYLPDLILMDIALPGMDGLALTRLIKTDPRTCSVPVIALSAFAMKGDEEKALAAGCNGYITKPISTRHFPAQILAYLQRNDR